MNFTGPNPPAFPRNDFKNFHRMLCERFGYGHDDLDWHRDQLSLIEWIAHRPVPSDSATMLALLVNGLNDTNWSSWQDTSKFYGHLKDANAALARERVRNTSAELLAALEEMVAEDDGGMAASRARAAINKARGIK